MDEAKMTAEEIEAKRRECIRQEWEDFGILMWGKARRRLGQVAEAHKKVATLLP